MRKPISSVSEEKQLQAHKKVLLYILNEQYRKNILQNSFFLYNQMNIFFKFI